MPSPPHPKAPTPRRSAAAVRAAYCRAATCATAARPAAAPVRNARPSVAAMRHLCLWHILENPGTTCVTNIQGITASKGNARADQARHDQRTGHAHASLLLCCLSTTECCSRVHPRSKIDVCWRGRRRKYVMPLIVSRGCAADQDANTRAGETASCSFLRFTMAPLQTAVGGLGQGNCTCQPLDGYNTGSTEVCHLLGG